MSRIIDRIARAVNAYGVPLAALRALEAVLKPRGVSVLSFVGQGADRGPDACSNSAFDDIAQGNRWGSNESISGVGSELAYTGLYRNELVTFLRERAIGSMFDAPCGDLNWMSVALKEVALSYKGGDISDLVINQNRARHPELETFVFDIRKDPFPEVDLWHCRDCLFHLSNDDVWAALANFAKSSCQFALMTYHSGWLRNLNIATGGFRYLDLRKVPFNLPDPERSLADYRPQIDFPRYVGVWRRQQILDVLASRRA